MTGEWVVYRLFDADDDLIYIGCTGNLTERMRHHRGHQPWWPEVARIDASETYPDQATALAAEREAITAARPKCNVRHANGLETAECDSASYAGYKRHRKRGEAACVACNAAHNEFARSRRARSLERGSLTHGKISTYNAGCHCDECRAAGSRRARRAAHQAAS